MGDGIAGIDHIVALVSSGVLAQGDPDEPSSSEGSSASSEGASGASSEAPAPSGSLEGVVSGRGTGEEAVESPSPFLGLEDGWQEMIPATRTQF